MARFFINSLLSICYLFKKDEKIQMTKIIKAIVIRVNLTPVPGIRNHLQPGRLLQTVPAIIRTDFL
jgi:hypothetical protein